MKFLDTIFTILSTEPYQDLLSSFAEGYAFVVLNVVLELISVNKLTFIISD